LRPQSLAVLCFLLCGVSFSQLPLDTLGARYDSLYHSSLNDDVSENTVPLISPTDDFESSGKSAQQLFEENPTYTIRHYDHKQQVIVGSVVMLCVALAMVAMNNYNPKH
jgi:hypothetical protein